MTDHNFLEDLVSKASLKVWLAYWAEFLMEFGFETINRQGKENIVLNTLIHSMLN